MLRCRGNGCLHASSLSVALRTCSHRHLLEAPSSMRQTLTLLLIKSPCNRISSPITIAEDVNLSETSPSCLPQENQPQQICQAASIGGTGAHKAGAAPISTSLHFKSSDFSSLSPPTLVCSSSFPTIVTPSSTTILTPVSRYSQASCHSRHNNEGHEGIRVPRARPGRHTRSHRG